MTYKGLKIYGSIIQRLIDKKDLTKEETYEMFRETLLNRQPDLQQGAFLAALVSKGETVDELVGAWQAIDEIDTVHVQYPFGEEVFENSGTGMDELKTFNVSSASAIVAASCGITMARHGARALTSKHGTVDIMESVGIDVECEVEVVANSIKEAGIGLFNGMSPKIHPSALFRILSQIRFGTTLNIAASLANPCRPKNGLRGVYTERIVKKVAEVMAQIGYKRAMVVYGKGGNNERGMDEVSLCGKTIIVEINKGGYTSYELHPIDVGLRPCDYQSIAALENPLEERKRFLRVIAGKTDSPCLDFTALNAGTILYVAGIVSSIRKGIDMAYEAMHSGKALERLFSWVSYQNQSPSRGLAILEAALSEAGVSV